MSAGIWKQTAGLRIVDVSSSPQMSVRYSLQQAWVEQTSGKVEWRPVPFAGHITKLHDCPDARLDDDVISVR